MSFTTITDTASFNKDESPSIRSTYYASKQHSKRSTGINIFTCFNSLSNPSSSLGQNQYWENSDARFDKVIFSKLTQLQTPICQCSSPTDSWLMRLKYWNLEEISDIHNKIILNDQYLAVRQDNARLLRENCFMLLSRYTTHCCFKLLCLCKC